MSEKNYPKELQAQKKKFLGKYSQISFNQEKFPFLFRSNPNIYSIEPQIPDVFLKTLNKFDKNSCFVFSNSNNILEPNILEEDSLEGRGELNNSLTVSKVEIDDLFNTKKPSKKKEITIDVFADDMGSNAVKDKKKTEQSAITHSNPLAEQPSKEESSIEAKNLESPNIGNSGDPVSSHQAIPGTQGQVVFQSQAQSQSQPQTQSRNKFNIYEEISVPEEKPNPSLFNEVNLVPKYFMNFKDDYFYGPYSTVEVFHILTRIQMQKDDNKFDFLLVDSLTDIFYNPLNLLDLIKEQLTSSEKQFSIESELNRATTSVKGKNQLSTNTNTNTNAENRNIEIREEVKGPASKFDKVKVTNPPKVFERKLKQPNMIVPKYDIPYFCEKFAGAEHIPMKILKNKDPNVEKAFKQIQASYKKNNQAYQHPPSHAQHGYNFGLSSPKGGYPRPDFLNLATPTSINFQQATPKGFGMYGNTPKSPMFFNGVTPKSAIGFNFGQGTPKNLLQSPSNLNGKDYYNFFNISPKASGQNFNNNKLRKTDLQNKFQTLSTVDENKLTNITDSLFD